MGAGERTFDVAEEFALEQLLRNGRAVDFDQRPFGTRTACVNRVRDQLLADARFALQQHSRRGIRDRFDPLQHAPQCRARADDAAHVHRDADFFPEVIALLLQLLAKPRILGQRAAQPALRAFALGDVLRSHQHPVDLTPVVAVRDGRHDDVQNAPVFRNHLPVDVGELAAFDRLLQPGACETAAVRVAVKVRDRPSEDLLSRVTELLQPVVGDRLDMATGVERMQHRRGQAIQIAVLELSPRLVGHLGVHRDRAHEAALRVVLDDRIAHAVDDLAGFRHETQRLAFQLAGAAQCRAKLLLDAAGALLGNELERAAADHLVTRVAKPSFDRVVDVEVAAVLPDGRGHRRSLAKQPLVVVIPAHRASLYEIS